MFIRLYFWCFWTVVLEKTLESPLDCKEIQPVHPKGNQSWIFIGRTDAEAETPDVKNWLIWKDPDAGKDWRQEKKGTTEDEMVGWHHSLSGNVFEKTGREWRTGSLVCGSPMRSQKVRADLATEQQLLLDIIDILLTILDQVDIYTNLHRQIS